MALDHSMLGSRPDMPALGFHLASSCTWPSSIRTAKRMDRLGAMIILLLWLYITGFVILLGGEINSEIGRATDAQQQQQDRRHPMDRELRAA